MKNILDRVPPQFTVNSYLILITQHKKKNRKLVEIHTNIQRNHKEERIIKQKTGQIHTSKQKQHENINF
jgi:hypothetical protein